MSNFTIEHYQRVVDLYPKWMVGIFLLTSITYFIVIHFQYGMKDLLPAKVLKTFIRNGWREFLIKSCHLFQCYSFPYDVYDLYPYTGERTSREDGRSFFFFWKPLVQQFWCISVWLLGFVTNTLFPCYFCIKCLLKVCFTC